MLYNNLVIPQALLTNCYICTYSVCNILNKNRQIPKLIFDPVKKIILLITAPRPNGIEVVIVPINLISQPLNNPHRQIHILHQAT